MSTPILSTKLYSPPPRTDLVARPRLNERLNEGQQRKLTLISAPAGFGKSTLVGEWLVAASHQAAWLSLDENDGELTRFLTYFISALQTLEQRADDRRAKMGSASSVGERVLNALQSPQPPPTESLLTALINEIATMPEAFTLVLDDYHMVDASDVDSALVFLIDHMPPQMHLLITTREDPPLPLARYRARGQLTEIRAADLRFSPAEAAGFFNQVMDLSLSESQINALDVRTEGWIAGLQLAALSMQGRSDLSTFIEAFTGSHYFVLDYLVEEVLQHRSEHERHFLLQTSILERLNGPLCNAITGDEDGAERLKMLERDNMFVISLDEKRQWYRYHHLFAEMLQARLLEEKSDQIASLHRRASMWYEEHNLRADAIHHSLAAEDFSRAADLIELAWPAMDGSFQTTAWLEWAKQLPEAYMQVRPVLCVAFAWAWLNAGELAPAETWLQEAERSIEKQATTDDQLDVEASEIIVVDTEQFRTLPASIATARAYHAQSVGDLSGSMQYAQQALDLLLEEDYVQRGPAAALLGLAFWELGELEAAHTTLSAAMEGFRMAGNITFAVSGTYGLADIRIAQGRLRAAIQTYEQALQLIDEQDGLPIRGTADLYLGLSALYHEQGESETAREHLNRSEDLGEQVALTNWPYRSRIIKAGFEASRGNLDGALHLLNEAERIYFPTPLPDVVPVAALKARVWIAQGRLSEAQTWALEQELSSDDKLTYLRLYEHMTYVRLLIATHRHNRTEPVIRDCTILLERLLVAAEAGAWIGSVIELLILQALAHEAQGDLRSGLVPLYRALALAEPEGYVRLFVDEGPPMSALLKEATKGTHSSDYVRRLQAAFDGSAIQKPTAQPIRTQEHPFVEPLSERELDVLRLFRSDMTGPEIANELVISLNTMRTHSKNIYSKLGVNSRRAAVRRGEELDLF